MSHVASIPGRGLGGRNGRPVGRPYAWRRGEARREAEAEAYLARIRAVIAASDTAGPGPDEAAYEWYREMGTP